MSEQNPIRLDQFDNGGFDRGAGRLKELIWMIAKAWFFQFHFPLPSALRRTLLRCFGAKIGKGVVIRSGVNITYPWRLEIGDHCWIGEDVFILSLAPVKIGEHTCVSQRAFICTGSHDFSQPTFELITRPVNIGAHSWIAAMAFVAPGTTIPANTMVRAGETVSSKKFNS